MILGFSATHISYIINLISPTQPTSNQGRSQDFSLRGSVHASEASRLRGDVFGWAKRVRYARHRRFFLGLTARKTARCNLAIEIRFVPSSQSTFNFSVLRRTQVEFLLFNLLRPGPGATRLAGELDFLKITASRTHLRASGKTKC